MSVKNSYGDTFKNDAIENLAQIADILEANFGSSKKNDSDGDSTNDGTSSSGGAVSKFSKIGNKITNFFNNINRSINLTKSSLTSMYSMMNHIIEPWAKADVAASKFAKTVAMTEQGMKNLRKNAINSVINGKLGVNYNISTDELIEAQQKYVQSVGRNLRIDSTQQESLAAMHAVMQGREQELATAFENFGVNLNGVADHAGKMFKEASKSGLSFEKYSDNVAKNIKIAQNYTFRNGLRGLESMAKKATALKLDMGQVASFADKVSTIEGSIDVASKLQVLGGQFAAIADPMAMLSEGLMDMEGLTDRIINMVGGLGNFNKATGEVEVSAFNKQRIKAAAQAMGIDYSQLMESVHASGRREAIDREIASSAHASGLNEDMKELLRNSATFDKNGKAGISVNGEFKSIEDLTNEDYKVLVKETQDQASDIKDIARMLRSIEDATKGTRKQYEATKAKIIEKTGAGDTIKDVTISIGESNRLLKIIATASIFGGLAGIASTLIKGFNGLKGIFRGGKAAKGVKRGVEAAHEIVGSGVKNTVRQSGKRYGGRLATKIGESRFGEQLGRFGVNSIKRVDTIGKNLTKKGYTKIGGALEKSALKQAKTVGLKNIPKYGGEKIATKTASKIGTKIASRAIKGGVLGLVGAAGNIATDMLVDSGRIKKGGGAHTAMKVGSTALEGAAMGAILGPVGAAVGAVAGAAIGAVKMAKVKREMAVDNKLQSMGIERKGNYGARSYKLIDKALATGKISNRMRRKLERNGDIDILNAIEKKKEEKEKNQATISKGMFTVKNAYFNGSAFGGRGGFGVIDLLNPMKMKSKTLDFTGSLLKGTTEKIGNIRGIPETGKGITAYERQKAYYESRNQGRGAYDINISGTITLVGDNGQKVDITDNLLHNGTFITQLTNKIINEWGEHSHGVTRQDVNPMGRM